VADIVGPDRRPNGSFLPGHNGDSPLQRGPDRGPRKSVLRAVVLQALAGEQTRGKGKNRKRVKAAALNDMVQQYQRIFAGKKVANAKYFLAAAEQVREVVDEDTQGAASMRRTLFILAGDYHDQRQVHMHQEGAEPPQGPAPQPGPPPVPREPLRDADGNVFHAMEPIE